MFAVAIGVCVIVSQELLVTDEPGVATAKKESREKSPYMITLDAGSSGTRVHVYIRDDNQASESNPALTAVSVNKHRPGLSDCAHGTSAEMKQCASEHISQLLAKVSKGAVRDETKAKPNVYLQATAGLRLLSEQVSHQLLEGAGEGIKAAGFGLPYPPRLITGTEEAMFAWLAVNLAGEGTMKQPVGDGSTPSTLGVMDLGGASTQIAFVVEGIPRSQHRIKLPKALGSHMLYAVSRLSFGLDEVFNAVADEATHPCAILGGHANFHSCLNQVKAFFDDYETQTEIRNVELPEGMQFVLLDNFYKAMAHVLFGIGDELTGLDVEITSCESLPFACTHAYRPTPRHIYLAGERICAASWSELRSLSKGAVQDSKLRKSCFAAAYSVTLLTNVYNIGFDERRLYIPDRMDGFDASWAFGAAAYQVLRDRSPKHIFYALE